MYRHLQRVVQWNGSHSDMFYILRGTRQGSLQSPYLFNILLMIFLTN